MSNFWSPQNISTYADRQAEHAAAAEQAAQAAAQQQAEEQRGALVQNVGPALVAMIRRYTNGYVHAEYDQVQRDFLVAFPSATKEDFAQTVNALVQSGHIMTRKGPDTGIMGTRTSFLYAA
jgi:t-SNARE complex subunit (syntaxin)